MKKRSRLLAVVMAAATMASVFAGCAGKKEAEVKSGTKTDEQKPVTLKLAIWDYSKEAAIQALVKAFQEENPNIKIEAQEISAADYINKMTVQLAGGDDTDIIAVKDTPSYSGYVQKKQIESLDSYIQKDGVDMTPFNKIEEALKVDGKLYGLPYRSDFWVMYYNKDIFDKAKVSYPKNDMTWTEFREMAKKLTSGEGNDKIYGTYAHTWTQCVPGWSVAAGKGNLQSGKYDFIKDSYEVWLPMQNEDKSTMPYATAKTGNVHYSGQFEQGKAATILMGSWFIGTLIKDKTAGKHNINWSAVTVPHFEGRKAGDTMGAVTPFAINAASKNKDAAWKFVKFAGTEKGASILAMNGAMPAYKTEAVIKTYLEVPGMPADIKDALNPSNVTIDNLTDPKAPAINKAVDEEHQLIMIGKSTVEQGIANMTKRVEEIKSGK